MSGRGLVSLGLKRLVDEAIRQYNRYRAPEAKAELLRIDGDTVIVLFRGSFCETCGINDWVEDFKFVLEDLGAEVELERIDEPEDPFSDEDWRIGYFRVKSWREPYSGEAEVGKEIEALGGASGD